MEKNAQGYLNDRWTYIDSDVQRTWYIPNSDYCKKFPLKYINDPRNRLIGYKFAIRELIRRLSSSEQDLEYTKWDKPEESFIATKQQEILEIKSKIMALMEMEIADFDEFTKWWNKNEDYIYLSNDKTKLLFDAEAKKQKKPIHEMNPEHEISAEEYWKHSVQPNYGQRKISDKYIHGYLQFHHGQKRIRVEKSQINDPKTKEKAYKSILENQIKALMVAREMKRQIHIGYALIPMLKVTGLDYKDSEQWIKWWQKNKDNLVLSEDGSRLVVKTK